MVNDIQYLPTCMHKMKKTTNKPWYANNSGNYQQINGLGKRVVDVNTENADFSLVIKWK